MTHVHTNMSRKLELPALDLGDARRCPAFRRALGLEGKGDRVQKQFQIDGPLWAVLEKNVSPGGRSDIVNQGINLIAVMNGWL
jgi:hypothetical protein